MEESEMLKYWDYLWKKDDYYAFHDIPSETDGIYRLLLKATENSKPAQTLLEVGSGPGTRSIPLAKEKNLELTLLDKLPSAHELAKKRSQRYGLVSEYFLGDARNLPLENNSFDYVVSIGLNEHFFGEDRKKVFSEMKRVTKNEGSTIVIVPNRWGAIQIEQNIKERKGTWTFGPTKLFNKKELEFYMNDCNFSDLNFYGTSFFTSPLRIFPTKIQRKVFRNKKIWDFWAHFPGNFNLESSLNKYFGEEIMAIGKK